MTQTKTKEQEEELSLCENCYCMTKTINGKCGKCKSDKNISKEQEKEIEFGVIKNMGKEKKLKVLIWKGTIKEMQEHPLYKEGFQQGKAEGYQEGIKQKADVMKKQWQDEIRKQIFCSKCGFPKEWERNPVFLKNDMFSLMHAEDNTCEECGHQADGYTIKKLEPLLQKYLGFGKKQARQEFIKIIDKCKIHTAGVLLLIEKEELQSKLYSQQETSAKGKAQSSIGELAKASMQRKPEQQHNPADARNGKELNKRLKIITSKSKIRLKELGEKKYKSPLEYEEFHLLNHKYGRGDK